MQISFDAWINLTGVFSFLNFFILHVVILRFVSAEKVLKWLSSCIWIALAGHLAFIFMCLGDGVHMIPSLGIRSDIIWGFLSIVIFILLVFFYILCIFGPTETSVRFRIIQELSLSTSQGMELKDLLKIYNAQTILKVRLKRLDEAGDILIKNDKYYLGKTNNIFFFLDQGAGLLKKFYGTK